MFPAQKYLKQKILIKLYSWRSVFSFFASGLSPYNDAFYLFYKKFKKSENPGHMRPGPWKSCHPGRKNRTCHVIPPPPLF
jgi:hypothetical protein